MTSSHSLYKHPNRKASALQKSVSSYQLKINFLKNNELKLGEKIKKLKKKETMYGGFLSELYSREPRLRSELDLLFKRLIKVKEENKQ